jgi:hypothetical protein
LFAASRLRNLDSNYRATMFNGDFLNGGKRGAWLAGIALCTAATLALAAAGSGRDSVYAGSAVASKSFSTRSAQYSALGSDHSTDEDAAAKRASTDSVAVQRFGRDSVYAGAPAKTDRPAPLARTDGAQQAPKSPKPAASAIQRFGRDSVYARSTRQRQTPTNMVATPVNATKTSASATLRDQRWLGQLDHLRNTVASKQKSDARVVGSAAVFTSTVSYGYVIWLLRGGLLLSSLLSSLPAWASLDPLPILASGKRDRKRGTEKADSVEILFGDTGPAAKRHSPTAVVQETVAAPAPVACRKPCDPNRLPASPVSLTAHLLESVGSSRESHG